MTYYDDMITAKIGYLCRIFIFKILILGMRTEELGPRAEENQDQ